MRIIEVSKGSRRAIARVNLLGGGAMLLGATHKFRTIGAAGRCICCGGFFVVEASPLATASVCAGDEKCRMLGYHGRLEHRSCPWDRAGNESASRCLSLQKVIGPSTEGTGGRSGRPGGVEDAHISFISSFPTHSLTRIPGDGGPDSLLANRTH